MAKEVLPTLDWSPWVPLEGARSHAAVPRLPGLDRIRSVETGRILYIGQTGRTRKERMGALKGVYGEVMPYNDPHTAGPTSRRLTSGREPPRGA